MVSTHKPKPIRDPIFNYIETTAVEQSVIDRPEFQRLRFILQNASAHLTYPGSCNTRFVHSLGVMRLSGEMFSRALENCEDGILEKYLQSADEAIGVFESRLVVGRDELLATWKKVLGNASRVNFRHLTGNQEDIDNSLYLINVIWQALRLAALVHDLGHLPLSHLFEYAIKDLKTHFPEEAEVLAVDLEKRHQDFHKLINEDDLKDEFKDLYEREVHEAIGIQVFSSFVPERDPGSDQSGFRDFCRLVYAISRYLLILRSTRIPTHSTGESATDKYSSLRCLHGIVAGELDADRLEYCVRDPAVSGLELGAIDVQRIVDSLAFHQEESSGFAILPSAKALSAVESFFHQRYLIYKYMIYHHNVVRMDGIAREIILRLLHETIKTEGSDIQYFPHLRELALWTDSSSSYRFLPSERFSHFDDAWLRTLMAESFFRLKSKEGDLSESMRIILVLLDTYLHRVTENVFSLWKRDCDYHTDMDAIRQEHGLDRQELGNRLVGYESQLYPLKTSLENDNHVVIIHRYLKPKVLSAGKQPLRILVPDMSGTREAQDAVQISPYLASLGQAAAESPRLHFSFVSVGIKQNETLKNDCRSRTLKMLEDWVCTHVESTVKEG